MLHLGLVLPTPSLFGKIEAGFRVIVLCGPRLLLSRSYYEPLLWFMIVIIMVLQYKKIY